MRALLIAGLAGLQLALAWGQAHAASITIDTGTINWNTFWIVVWCCFWVLAAIWSMIVGDP